MDSGRACYATGSLWCLLVFWGLGLRVNSDVLLLIVRFDLYP